MIGIILCGHGRFASGLSSAVALIIGKDSLDLLKYHDFTNEVNYVELKERIEASVLELKEKCNEVIICSDIISGTPFNISSKLAMEDDTIKLIYGINLPILIQILLDRNNFEKSDDLISNILDIDEKIIGVFNKQIINEIKNDDDL